MPTAEASSKLSRAAKYIFWTMMLPAVLTLALLQLFKAGFGDEDITLLMAIIIIFSLLGIAFFSAWVSSKKTRSFANDLAARFLVRVILALATVNAVYYLWLVTVW
jgi:hypothetical protein